MSNAQKEATNNDERSSEVLERAESGAGVFGSLLCSLSGSLGSCLCVAALLCGTRGVKNTQIFFVPLFL